MATTYELIDSNTLTTATASVTFSSIPLSFDDLVVVASARSDRSGQAISEYRIRLNGDTGSNYSQRRLSGNGSTAASDSASSATSVYFGIIPGPTATSNTFSSGEFYVPNYAGSTNKSLSVTNVHETNATGAYIHAVAGLWSDTSTVSSITIFDSLAQMVSGSSFFLYGITKA